MTNTTTSHVPSKTLKIPPSTGKVLVIGATDTKGKSKRSFMEVSNKKLDESLWDKIANDMLKMDVDEDASKSRTGSEPVKHRKVDRNKSVSSSDSEEEEEEEEEPVILDSVEFPGLSDNVEPTTTTTTTTTQATSRPTRTFANPGSKISKSEFPELPKSHKKNSYLNTTTTSWSHLNEASSSRDPDPFEIDEYEVSGKGKKKGKKVLLRWG
jgi:hypothetical protein